MARSKKNVRCTSTRKETRKGETQVGRLLEKQIWKVWKRGTYWTRPQSGRIIFITIPTIPDDGKNPMRRRRRRRNIPRHKHTLYALPADCDAHTTRPCGIRTVARCSAPGSSTLLPSWPCSRSRSPCQSAARSRRACRGTFHSRHEPRPGTRGQRTDPDVRSHDVTLASTFGWPPRGSADGTTAHHPRSPGAPVVVPSLLCVCSSVCDYFLLPRVFHYFVVYRPLPLFVVYTRV